MEIVFIVNRVIEESCNVINKYAFPSKELAEKYLKWMNEKLGSKPSWIEEISIINEDYSMF